ncbi:hypothetical protein LY78DRAFT_687538 [Colletotrichum sublineola]|nr:hypothetical protein LY78DRAFT_687538 [Colletotrichum sublineola]
MADIVNPTVLKAARLSQFTKTALSLDVMQTLRRLHSLMEYQSPVGGIESVLTVAVAMPVGLMNI